MHSAIMVEFEQKCIKEARETSPGSLCQGLERRPMCKALISLPCTTFLVFPVVKLTGEGHHHLQDKGSISQLISKACLCRDKKPHQKKKSRLRWIKMNTGRETTWGGRGSTCHSITVLLLLQQHHLADLTTELNWTNWTGSIKKKK